MIISSRMFAPDMAQYDTLSSPALQHPTCGRVMQCPEQLRLQQLYDAALRRWAQISMPTQLDGERTYLAEQVRLRVMQERDTAKDRLRYHRRYCSACRRKSSATFGHLKT